MTQDVNVNNSQSPSYTQELSESEIYGIQVQDYVAELIEERENYEKSQIIKIESVEDWLAEINKFFDEVNELSWDKAFESFSKRFSFFMEFVECSQEIEQELYRKSLEMYLNLVLWRYFNDFVRYWKIMSSGLDHWLDEYIEAKLWDERSELRDSLEKEEDEDKKREIEQVIESINEKMSYYNSLNEELGTLLNKDFLKIFHNLVPFLGVKRSDIINMQEELNGLLSLKPRFNWKKWSEKSKFQYAQIALFAFIFRDFLWKWIEIEQLNVNFLNKEIKEFLVYISNGWLEPNYLSEEDYIENILEYMSLFLRKHTNMKDIHKEIMMSFKDVMWKVGKINDFNNILNWDFNIEIDRKYTVEETYWLKKQEAPVDIFDLSKCILEKRSLEIKSLEEWKRILNKLFNKSQEKPKNIAFEDFAKRIRGFKEVVVCDQSLELELRKISLEMYMELAIDNFLVDFFKKKKDMSHYMLKSIRFDAGLTRERIQKINEDDDMDLLEKNRVKNVLKWHIEDYNNSIYTFLRLESKDFSRVLKWLDAFINISYKDKQELIWDLFISSKKEITDDDSLIDQKWEKKTLFQADQVLLFCQTMREMIIKYYVEDGNLTVWWFDDDYYDILKNIYAWSSFRMISDEKEYKEKILEYMTTLLPQYTHILDIHDFINRVKRDFILRMQAKRHLEKRWIDVVDVRF